MPPTRLINRFIFILTIITLLSKCYETKIIVQDTKNGDINTILIDAKLLGLSYQKRTINYSSEASLEFTLSDENGIGVFSRVWYVNGVDSTKYITAYASKPTNPPDIYTTDKTEVNAVTITLHVRNKRLVPGNYTLSVRSLRDVEDKTVATAFLHVTPILSPFSKVRKVLEGDRLSIFCQITAYPPPQEVTWYFAHVKPDLMEDATALAEAQSNVRPLQGPSTIYSFVTNTVANDQLVFEELPANYSGLYVCRVPLDESLILVNIKDRWAALWPFIGIVVEVAVLCTGILLYERYQMRARANKNDAPAAAPAGAAAELSPKAGEPGGVLPQQNNVSAAAGEPPLHVEMLAGDGSKTEADDPKPEEVRLRTAPQR